jgi:hypothetical protein
MEWELDEETGLQRREVPTDVLPESLLLLRNRRWLVGVPLTYHAACWWGSWTQWCTARDEPSFDLYFRQGPLVVFMERVASWRWQLHPATGEFRDMDGRRVSWRGFVSRNPEVLDAFVPVPRRRRR